MADDDAPPAAPEVDKVPRLASLEEYRANKASEATVTATAFVSALCERTPAALAAMKEIAADEALKEMHFCHVDVAASPELAKEEGISGLPSFFFHYDGKCLEGFTGDNMEKLKLCAKAADLKKKELQVAKAKAKEEEEKLAAQRAAEEAAAAASGTADAA